VRELEHVVERTVVMSPERCIRGCHVALPGVSGEARPKDFRTAKSRIVWHFEHTYLEDLLTSHRGNISRAARAAGKNRRALWELIRKHRISVERFRQESAA
jgi:DNA-binding NtrC family response regulator